MKYTTRIALLALALSALLAGRNATAEPADAAANAIPKPVGEQPKKCDRWEGKEKRLETLKADLKLSVNQEAAWTEWVTTTGKQDVKMPNHGLTYPPLSAWKRC